MSQRMWIIQAACLLGLGIVSGCASLMPPSPLAPFFPADAADGTLIDALAHEQYTRVEHCQERKSCPQDHYTRALIALFQSRERALASFQQVRTLPSNSRMAATSMAWIDLLQANSGGLSMLTMQKAGAPTVTEDFVWETLERDLGNINESVRQLFGARAKRLGNVAHRPSVPSQNRAMLTGDKDQAAIVRETDQATVQSREKDQETVQALPRQLQERERMIAERENRLAVMSSQLDDLKRIELDTRERRRPARPSTTVSK